MVNHMAEQYPATKVRIVKNLLVLSDEMLNDESMI